MSYINYHNNENSLISFAFEGLNFIAFECVKKNIHSCSCASSSINCMYEKNYDPTKLVRFDIKKDPTEVFNKNKKEAKVKKI